MMRVLADPANFLLPVPNISVYTTSQVYLWPLPFRPRSAPKNGPKLLNFCCNVSPLKKSNNLWISSQVLRTKDLRHG